MNLHHDSLFAVLIIVFYKFISLHEHPEGSIPPGLWVLQLLLTMFLCFPWSRVHHGTLTFFGWNTFSAISISVYSVLSNMFILIDWFLSRDLFFYANFVQFQVCLFTRCCCVVISHKWSGDLKGTGWYPPASFTFCHCVIYNATGSGTYKCLHPLLAIS